MSFDSVSVVIHAKCMENQFLTFNKELRNFASNCEKLKMSDQCMVFDIIFVIVWLTKTKFELFHASFQDYPVVSYEFCVFASEFIVYRGTLADMNHCPRIIQTLQCDDASSSPSSCGHQTVVGWIVTWPDTMRFVCFSCNVIDIYIGLSAFVLVHLCNEHVYSRTLGQMLSNFNIQWWNKWITE